MKQEYIRVGRIVNAHGIRGEVKVNPAGFDPEFIADFKTMYIAGQPVKVKAARVHKSTVLLALPGGMAPSERQTLVDVLVDAGVRSVVPVDESVASAIGAGMRIDQPYGRMNIDIGGGRTNVSVFSFGHQIVWDILNVGGDRFDDAIIDYLRKKHNLLIGIRTAEELKKSIGCVKERPEISYEEVKGRCLMTGLPRTITLNSDEMVEALAEPTETILETVHMVLERTPPELVADISENGIVMSGGGSLLYGIDRLVTERTGIEAHVADDALSCTAYGAGRMLSRLDSMTDGMQNFARQRQLDKTGN